MTFPFDLHLWKWNWLNLSFFAPSSLFAGGITLSSGFLIPKAIQQSSIPR